MAHVGFRVYGLGLEGRWELASRFLVGIARPTIRLIGVINVVFKV